ncbi:MAG: alpha/beta hydrolase [Rhodobacteraceae bacterium]|nr:alpha/beta hydrolase [Paracoccaceae bacterium]
MRSLPIVLLCATLIGCTGSNLPTHGSQSPLKYELQKVEKADTLVFLVPGALASVKIFGAEEVWQKNGSAIVQYRFPGLDGLPLDHALDIDSAAGTISRFANRYPNKKFRLAGYSTGGPIAITAASRIKSNDVKVAAISTAVEFGGGLETQSRGAFDVVNAAFRAGTLQKDEIWYEYYRILLFGRSTLDNPKLAEKSSTIVRQEKKRLVVPDSRISKAHTSALRSWQLPAAFDIPNVKIQFFVGLEDPVFSRRQTLAFARKVGASKISGYRDQGHLIFLTNPGVFKDVRAFFDAN